jgi:nucleoside-diphosphate-sugar epimerase
MSVLVTGALGFVGSNIVRELVAAGDDVVALHHGPLERDIASRIDGASHGSVTYLHGDVRDGALVERAMHEWDITHVVHAAAITPTAEMEVEHPATIVETNELSTLTLLTISARLGVTRFLFLSSGAVYSESDDAGSITEESTLRDAGGLYALTKIAGERLCRWATERYGIDTRVVRPGSIYGPFERPTSSRRNMSLVYRAVRLALDGDVLVCNAPESLQGWIHARDAVLAVRLILHSPSLRHRTYNIAGPGVRIEQLIGGVAAAIPATRVAWVDRAEDANLPIASAGRYRGMSIARLEQDTGFAPRFSIEAGIRDYVAWLMAEPERG